MENLKNNLDNIKIKYDLFGNEVKQLSMRDRIGFLPISIWHPNWQVVKQLKELVGDNGEKRFIDDQKSGNFRRGGQWVQKQKKVGSFSAFSDQSKTIGRGNNNYAIKEGLGNQNNNVSIFNPHLAQMILSAYCPSNAKIYDAFGGGGTRGFIASAMGHNYTGIEIRQGEVDRIKKKQIELNTFFNIVCADSRYYNIEPESFDFSYTCPPYYDLEVYSHLEGDMSCADTYVRFLEMLKESLTITYQGLKKDCLCVLVIGNFRDKDGNLIHFSGDTIRLAKEIGFQLHDELIFWGASGSANQRVGNFEANRRSVRVHEYIIILKK